MILEYRKLLTDNTGKRKTALLVDERGGLSLSFAEVAV